MFLFELLMYPKVEKEIFFSQEHHRNENKVHQEKTVTSLNKKLKVNIDNKLLPLAKNVKREMKIFENS